MPRSQYGILTRKALGVVVGLAISALIYTGRGIATESRTFIQPTQRPVIARVVMNAVQPFDLEEVKLLESPFKKAMDLNAKYLLSLEPDRFLHYFRVNAKLPPKAPPYGGWESPNTGAGRCLGHYLSALSLQYRATGDRRFKERVDYIVRELAACQQTNGFLSAQSNLAEAFAVLAKSQGNALFKSRVPWYIQHKMFAGLRDAYSLTGNEQARQILIRLADWAVSVTANLSDEQFQLMLQQEYGGMEEVLTDVYAMTGNQNYLEMARRFADVRTFKPLESQTDALNGMHANTMIPKITGAVRLYEWTGEATQCRLAKYFWDQVVGHHTYVIGGTSDHEHFGPPDQLGLDIDTAETCDTYNMLKLTRELFCLDPEVKYADYYERALYNDILASQEPKSGMFTYFMPLKSGHFKTYSTPDASFWCCVGTGMENHTQYGNSIYFHNADNLYVNLFIPSELKWLDKGVTIRQETDYPATGRVNFTFKCARPVSFTFNLRYPGWAEPGATVVYRNQPIAPETQPGDFFKLTRLWKNGDRITLDIPMQLRTESLPGAVKKTAFLYGPLVLAGDLGTNGLSASAPYATDSQQFNKIADPEVPGLMVGDAPLTQWLHPIHGKPLTFSATTTGEARNVLLRPFYEIYYGRYTVYWDIREPQLTKSLNSVKNIP